MSARVPTSRAYWNLRAEQVMDQVFDRETVTAPSQPHLVPVDVDVHEPTAPAPAPDRRSPSPWLLPLMSGVAVAGLTSCILRAFALNAVVFSVYEATLAALDL